MKLHDQLALFAKTPVIPVLTIENVDQAAPLARALCEGGLSVIEVTLRTKAALDAIRIMTETVPEAIVGAGTLCCEEDIALARKAGARFLVTPGTPLPLAEVLRKSGLPALPGCATASEAMALSALGFPALKFFPAEASGGVNWLKAIAAPLPDLRFCPTGGITFENAASYLALPNVFAVGGSWVVPKAVLAANDFARIATLAREAANLRPE